MKEYIIKNQYIVMELTKHICGAEDICYFDIGKFFSLAYF